MVGGNPRLEGRVLLLLHLLRRFLLHRVQEREQLRLVHRLEQIIHGAEPDGLPGNLEFIVARQEHMTAAAALPRLPKELQAVHVRHVYIRYDKIRLPLRHQLQRLQRGLAAYNLRLGHMDKERLGMRRIYSCR